MPSEFESRLSPPNQKQAQANYRSHQYNQIYHANGYSTKGYTYYPVIVVGAGESGICMGYALKQRLGTDAFRIYDRQSGIGGTWWINRYPGVACDIPAVFYSFSFAQNSKWQCFYPGGPEIYDYLQDVCDRFGLTEKIELNTDVVECRWLEDVEEWEVTLQHLVAGTGDLSIHDRHQRIKELGSYSVYSSREIVRCKVLVSGTGSLVEPNTFPKVLGAESFKGKVFHSARWDYSVDLKHKDVVVLGSGCTAIQSMPHLLKEPFNVKSLTQLMRTPPWIEPRTPTPFGDEGWAKIAPIVFTYTPGALRLLRLIVFLISESHWYKLFGMGYINTLLRKRREKGLLDRMKKLAPSKYHELLTPDYALACKRRIFDNVWYGTLHDPKVELTSMPLTSVQEHSITIGPGTTFRKTPSEIKEGTQARTIPADVIVLANGFQTHQWLHPMSVKGVGGVDLVEAMNSRGGAQAYQGCAFDNYPNFFMLYGPNTNTGHSSVILAIENSVNYVSKFVKLILDGDARTVDVKQEAEVAYTKKIQDALQGNVVTHGGCNSWYLQDGGWNPSIFPYSQLYFWYRCRFPRWSDWNVNYTTKGLAKLIISRGLKVALLFVLVSGWWKLRKSRMSLGTIASLARMLAISKGVDFLERAQERLDSWY